MNRQKTFDRVKQTTQEVLRKPAVIAVLGNKATLYSQMIKGAFLPDYYDGSLQLPADQLFEDNVAIVPFKGSAGSTPIANQFLQWPRYIDYLQTIGDNSQDFYGIYRSTQLNESMKRSGLRNAVAMTMAGIKYDWDQKYSFTARPIVYINSVVNREPDELVATDMVHEFCHVDNATQNYEATRIPKDKLSNYPEAVVNRAYQEKLAYNVGYQVLVACGIDTIDIAKQDLKDKFEHYSGKDVNDALDFFGRHIKGHIDNHDRAMCMKPFFSNIPREAISLAINEVFGSKEQPLTDEEIAAYKSVGIICH